MAKSEPLCFKDRKEAGLLLAERLKSLKLKGALVLAIPRGGVVLGCEIAKKLKLELDIITPRKLRDPYNPELAIGAVMHDGSIFINEEVIAMNSIPSRYIEKEEKRQRSESLRRFTEYRGKRAYPRIKDRTVILVDDGVATGASMVVAARWLKSQKAGKIIIAAPVIHPEVLNILKTEVNEVIYLGCPSFFYAIGQFYESFEQLEDSEVIKLLSEC